MLRHFFQIMATVVLFLSVIKTGANNIFPPSSVSVRNVGQQLEITIQPQLNNNGIENYNVQTDVIGPLSFSQTSNHPTSDNSNSLVVSVSQPPAATLRLPEETTFFAASVERGGIVLSSRVVTPLSAIDGTAFSFSAWVKCTNLGSNIVHVFDLGTGQNDDNIVLAFEGTTKKMYYKIYHGSIEGQTIKTDMAFPLDSWVLVQLLHRTDQTITLYWDGMEKASGSLPLPLITERTWYIGKSHTSGATNFEGAMKEIVFYNTEMNIGCYSIGGEWSTIQGTQLMQQVGCSGTFTLNVKEWEFTVTGSGVTVFCIGTTITCKTGVLLHDGTEIAWSTGEVYSKTSVRETITWNMHQVAVTACTNSDCSTSAANARTDFPGSPTSVKTHVVNDNKITITIFPPLPPDDGGMDVTSYEIMSLGNHIKIGCDETFDGTVNSYRGW